MARPVKAEEAVSRPARGQAGLALAESALVGGTVGAAIVVSAANAEALSGSAAPLAQMLGNGQLPRLAKLAERALARGQAGREVIVVADGEREQALDCAALPLAGEARVLVLAHDVSLTRNLHRALVDSRQRYKDLVECSTDFAWETDATGRFVFVTPRGTHGYQAVELVGRQAVEFQLDEPGEDPPSCRRCRSRTA